MKTYLLCAAGAIFLSVIVTLLIPEGKLHKTVTFIMRLICIFVLIQPLANVTTLFPQAEQTILVDYDYVAAVYSEQQSEQLALLLREKYAWVQYCEVEIQAAEGQFEVTGVSVGLSEDNQKNISEIYAYLEELGYINITVYATGP